VVGVERQLALQVRGLLQDAGLAQTQLVATPSLQQTLDHLGVERPGIVFLGVGLPDLANLNALVRLQAAAPGVPIVPLRFTLSRALELPTWDRKRLPLPFSTITLRFGRPICVDTGNFEAAIRELTDAL